VNLIKNSAVLAFSILAIIACGTDPTNSDSQNLLSESESEKSILEIGRGKQSAQKSGQRTESKLSKKDDCDDKDEDDDDDQDDEGEDHDDDVKGVNKKSMKSSVECDAQQAPSIPNVKPPQSPVQPPKPPVQPPKPPVQPPKPPVQPPTTPVQPPTPPMQPPAPPVQPPAPPMQPPMDPASQLQSQYNSSIKAIIDSRCQTCHAGTNPKLGTFADVKAASSRAAAAVSKGSMPLGSALSAADKTSLVDFFTQVSKLP
jgi:outer membrane biosynthesis protein TonB